MKLFTTISVLILILYALYTLLQNMKKSWHPLTLQNLERVWKAEQRHEAEQKRIAELQSEIKEERSREEMQKMAVDSGISK